MSTQILRNSGAQLRHSWYVDGTLTDPDSNACTVVVIRADGTVLQTSTTTTRISAGVYAYTLAPQADLDLLSVSWTGVFSGVSQTQTDLVEIVGGFYATIAELQALPGLTAMTDDQVVQARQEFEDLAERYCGRAFVPRFAREAHPGRYSTSLLLDRYPVRAILAASSTDTAGVVTAFTVTNWRVTNYGQITTDGDTFTGSIYGERNLWISYEHGEDAPPAALKRACREWVQATLLSDRSQVSRTVLSVTDPSGFSTRYGTIDWEKGRPTGIESVDAVLNGLGRRAPSIA